MRSIPPELAQSALDAAPDAMMIVDGSGVVQFANRQVSTLFGYDHEEVIGKPVERLLPERYRSRHIGHRDRYVGAAHLRPMGVGLDLYAQRQDGSEFPVEISLSPIEGQPGTLIAAAIRDVTERKRVEAELRHLQSIADTALSGESTETLIRALLTRLRAALNSDTATILLADADGQHLTPFASDGMGAEIGGEIQVPVGRGVAGRIALSDGPIIFEDLSQIEVVSPTLRSRVRSLMGAPLRSRGRLVGIVHAGSSVSRKFTPDEARLLSLAADRIGMSIEHARLGELEQVARRTAEAATQAKSRFLATASHDLRQPLQALALLNRTLRSIVKSPDATEALAQQEQTIASMSRLLNALLDISKLESGTIKPEITNFPIAKLFGELRREFSSLAEDKGLSLQVADSDEWVHSDASLLEEVLRNLVSNAIKYTQKGSVRLELRRAPQGVYLDVHDTGIGIPADQVPFIFDEFFQVGVSTNSSREGYGLGLSIVQRIAALLGLSLSVRSEPGCGSTFSVAVSLGKEEQAAAHKTSDQPAAQERIRGARILIVEDEPAVRNAARLLLSVEGYSVTAVASLSEAQHAARQGEKIALLITDYHLRDETGLTVIAAMREVIGQDLKTLLITGDTSLVVRKISEDANLRIISKPVNADEMLRLISTLLA
jgi:two-component system, sensor histidine kinase